MTAILDFVIPARRREKEMREKAFNQQLDDRWGDTSISPPLLGGWQPGKEVSSTSHNENPSASGFIPGYGYHQPMKPNTTTFGNPEGADSQSVQEKEKKQHNAKNLTVNLSLPWSSNVRRHVRSNSLPKDQKSPVFTHKPSAPTSPMSDNGTSTSTTAPSFRYKPISEEYKKDLAETIAPNKSPTSTNIGTPSEKSPTTPPPPRGISPAHVGLPKFANDEFMREISNLGMVPSPGLPPDKFGQLHPFKSSSPSPPLSNSTSPSPSAFLDLAAPRTNSTSPKTRLRESVSSSGSSNNGAPRSISRSPSIKQRGLTTDNESIASGTNGTRSRTLAFPTKPVVAAGADVPATSLSDSEVLPAHPGVIRHRSPTIQSTHTFSNTTSVLSAPTIPTSTTPAPRAPTPLSDTASIVRSFSSTSGAGGGGGGYYSKLAQEYRQIAKDVEEQALLSESENEAARRSRRTRSPTLDSVSTFGRSTGGIRRRDHSAAGFRSRKESSDMGRRRARSHSRIRSPKVGPQELVPAGQDLWG